MKKTKSRSFYVLGVGISIFAMVLIFFITRYFSILEQGRSTGAEYVLPLFVPLFLLLTLAVAEIRNAVNDAPEEDEDGNVISEANRFFLIPNSQSVLWIQHVTSVGVDRFDLFLVYPEDISFADRKRSTKAFFRCLAETARHETADADSKWFQAAARHFISGFFCEDLTEISRGALVSYADKVFASDCKTSGANQKQKEVL